MKSIQPQNGTSSLDAIAFFLSTTLLKFAVVFHFDSQVLH